MPIAIDGGSAPLAKVTLEIEGVTEDFGSAPPASWTWLDYPTEPGNYTLIVRAWNTAGNLTIRHGCFTVYPPITATEENGAALNTADVGDPDPTPPPLAGSPSDASGGDSGGASSTDSTPRSLLNIASNPTMPAASQPLASLTAANAPVWGGAALALAAAATAYALAEKERKQREAQRANQAKKAAQAATAKSQGAFAGHLSDAQVMAQIQQAGGDPNMSIEQARVIVHNAYVGSQIKPPKPPAKTGSQRALEAEATDAGGLAVAGNNPLADTDPIDAASFGGLLRKRLFLKPSLSNSYDSLGDLKGIYLRNFGNPLDNPIFFAEHSYFKFDGNTIEYIDANASDEFSGSILTISETSAGEQVVITHNHHIPKLDSADPSIFQQALVIEGEQHIVDRDSIISGYDSIVFNFTSSTRILGNTEPATIASEETIAEIKPGSFVAVTHLNDTHELTWDLFKVTAANNEFITIEDPQSLIWPGDSGGPAFYEGELIGVTSRINWEARRFLWWELWRTRINVEISLLP
jgi:hypothetical protein